MFFDWEYHEPKGYISHRFSKGDIAFVQNRYRGMEWTCMVGRKLDFPIEGGGHVYITGNQRGGLEV